MNDLTIPLQSESKEPLYQQIYNYIKTEVQEGRLPAGQKLPSTRALSAHLHVSRSTVDLSYEQLLSEGYIESIPYKGHFVCEIAPLYRQEHRSVTKVQKPKMEAFLYDFSPNRIDMSVFPFATWKRISKNVFLDEEREIFAMGDAQGDWRLRETICKYLHASRGVLCEPDQIIVGAGSDYLLLLLQKILKDVDVIAVENPTYMRAAHIFASGNASVCPIPLDESGMRMDLLRQSGAKIAYITPTHQFPTGLIMPVGRRNEMLGWANEAKERFIIEDDYDSEFRFRGRPIPSLQASDHNDKVIYLGTFSKTIAPTIRVGYMVLPKPLLEIFHREYWFLSSTVSRIDQSILYHFMEEGHFERYLNKMRKNYREKHDVMMEALKPFKKDFVIKGATSGLHVILEDQLGRDEEELVSLAKAVSCKVYPMQAYVLEELPGKAQILLGFAALSKEQIKEGIMSLQKAWGVE